jgi:nicotinamidase-related amidase
VSSVHKVLTEWAGRKNKVIHFVMKGMNCLTYVCKLPQTSLSPNNNLYSEMYSAVMAEVPIVSDPSTQVDPRFIDALKKAEKLVIGGQALSHCVRYTLTDIVKYWHEGTEEKKKIVLLEDGCSPVSGFEETAKQFVNDMRNEGVTVTTCAKAFGETKALSKDAAI